MAEGPKTPKGPAGDADLFRKAMRDVNPLKRRRAPPPLAEETVLAASPKAPLACKHKPASSPDLPRQTPRPAATPNLGHGDIAGLDRSTGLRFRRGQLPVEARLDLHGLTQAEAHGALAGFLAAQQAAGRRCVVVVTGKGVAREGGGVLRAAVPRWLNEYPNRDRVLAFEYARQKDGGAGALYVLLKRQRG